MVTKVREAFPEKYPFFWAMAKKTGIWAKLGDPPAQIDFEILEKWKSCPNWSAGGGGSAQINFDPKKELRI